MLKILSRESQIPDSELLAEIRNFLESSGVQSPTMSRYYSCGAKENILKQLADEDNVPNRKLAQELIEKIFDEIFPQIVTSHTMVFEELPIFENLEALVRLILNIVLALQRQPNEELARIFEQNTKDYTSLKKALIKHNFDRAATFNIRSAKVFKWCGEVIPCLVHDPLNEVWDHEKKSEKTQRLNLVSVKLAVYDTRIDDIADNIQDPKLTEWFCKIFRAEKKELSGLRKSVEKYQTGIYLEFFDNTVALWDEIKRDLRTLFEEGDAKKNINFDSTFSLHMEQLMEAMRYSVKMNERRVLPSFLEMEECLSSNMMVQILFDFQLALLQQFKVMPSDKQFATKFQIMTKIMEKMFHHSNSCATCEREMMEMDSTNPLFKLANDIFMGLFKVWIEKSPGKTFNDYIQAHFKVKIALEAESFIDLIVPPDRASQFSIMKTVEGWYLQHGLMEESILINATNYLEAQERLLNISKSKEFEGKKTEDIAKKIELINEIYGRNKARIQLVNEMMMENKVIKEYLIHWKKLYRELEESISAVQGAIPTLFQGRDILQAALEKFKVTSSLFLINYLISSRVRGGIV
jgi:hypothetical protein